MNKPGHPRTISILALPVAALISYLPLNYAWSQSGVVEERVSNEGGFIQACGEGDGLAPCRDLNGQTYDEEVRGPDIDAESTDELAAGAARIRKESPKELDQTIGDMEQGINPDNRATEGLGH